MKQWRELPGLWIDRGDIAAFEPVAEGASQCKITGNRPAAMLHCDHMIQLMFRQRESF
jgi:hypothetical protein